MRAAHTPNALPLSRSQWWALIAAAGRELGWGLRAVAREVNHWHARALAIPDAAIRRDAQHALDAKRGHIDGAAMFWTLPRRRDPVLLRMLVHYELLQDFLDGVSEAGGSLGPDRGAPLYNALADALDIDRHPRDYFAELHDRDDGGYLMSLVAACRDGCRALPSYRAVRPLLLREAARADVLLLNHDPRPLERASALRQWAVAHREVDAELRWHELPAAASGWITTHALLALAGQVRVGSADAEAMYAAYFPWLALTLTMLDSYVDQAEDHASGDHSYLSYYRTPAEAVDRLCVSIGRAANDVLALPNGDRHGVLLGCMIALYLSKDSARAPELRAKTAQIAAAGGSLTRLLLPVLRAWRACNGQRRTT